MKKNLKNIFTHFIGGVTASAICMFIIKLILGTQWDSEDIYSVISFGFAGLFFLIPSKFISK
tara:strand:- start:221 stop:406 length:186 start_codon:yes stop_codon:yes gene_type:complete